MSRFFWAVMFVCFFCSFFPFAREGSAEETILPGPSPDEFPGSEKCAVCHGAERILAELVIGPHAELKCLDCHLPGKVQAGKKSFQRFGIYCSVDKGWIESSADVACKRCHLQQSLESDCASCHMQKSDILDEIIFVKDKKQKISPENIREVKKMIHISHAFKRHSRK